MAIDLVTSCPLLCFTVPCEPGYVSVNGLETAAHGTPADCQPCPLGYYQPIKGQESCITCPEGENTSSIATIHREQCIRKYIYSMVIPLTILYDRKM